MHRSLPGVLPHVPRKPLIRVDVASRAQKAANLIAGNPAQAARPGRPATDNPCPEGLRPARYARRRLINASRWMGSLHLLAGPGARPDGTTRRVSTELCSAEPSGLLKTLRGFGEVAHKSGAQQAPALFIGRTQQDRAHTASRRSAAARYRAVRRGKPRSRPLPCGSRRPRRDPRASSCCIGQSRSALRL
jgi:hypothetical protein